jgi:hypothetical protein
MLAVELRGQRDLGTTAVDQNGMSFTVTGMSGITRLGGEEFIAVMDNSNKLVRILLTLDAGGAIVSASYGAGVSLADTRDFEGVAPTGVPGSVFLAEEGTPGVLEYRLSDGARTGTLTTPAVFLNRRANFGFESLTRDAGDGSLWTGNEEALTVDGELSTPTVGSLVRLLRYAPRGRVLAPAEQFAYLTEPMHGAVLPSARSGLSDLVALPSGRLIALERSFAIGGEGLFRTRIFELTTAGATNVAGLSGLIGQTVTRVGKRLLWDGDLTNLEGLCLGPALAGGGFALVGVVDDGDPISVNRVVVFRLTGPVEPECVPDLNGDGVVDFNDFLEFLNLYNAGDPRVDFNGDGTIDFNDLLEYLNLFNAGC